MKYRYFNLHGNRVFVDNGLIENLEATAKHHVFYLIPSNRHGRKYQPSIGVWIRYGRNDYYQGVLSRFIMKAPKGTHVDHINRNRFDNRSKNLRVCTPSENQLNQNKITKGVWYEEKRKKWRVELCRNSKIFWVGYFKTYKEGRKAYLDAVAAWRELGK